MALLGEDLGDNRVKMGAKSSVLEGQGKSCFKHECLACWLKNFSRQHFEIFFIIKWALTFHANCLLRRQFA